MILNVSLSLLLGNDAGPARDVRIPDGKVSFGETITVLGTYCSTCRRPGCSTPCTYVTLSRKDA